MDTKFKIYPVKPCLPGVAGSLVGCTLRSINNAGQGPKPKVQRCLFSLCLFAAALQSMADRLRLIAFAAFTGNALHPRIPDNPAPRVDFRNDDNESFYFDTSLPRYLYTWIHRYRSFTSPPRPCPLALVPSPRVPESPRQAVYPVLAHAALSPAFIAIRKVPC